MKPRRRHKVVVEVTFSKPVSSKEAQLLGQYFFVGKRYKDVNGTLLQVMATKEFARCARAALKEPHHDQS